LPDQFDPADVFAAVREHSPERVAEFAGVNASQSAIVIGGRAMLETCGSRWEGDTFPVIE
jgi:hypothetical protein